MPVRCDDLADLLAASAGGPGGLADERAREHADGCLRCQAELVRYRKLVRGLRSLRAELLEPAPGLMSDVFDVLEAAGERHAVRSLIRGRRVALAGGVAATLAGAGATYLLLSRRTVPSA